MSIPLSTPVANAAERLDIIRNRMRRAALRFDPPRPSRSSWWRCPRPSTPTRSGRSSRPASAFSARTGCRKREDKWPALRARYPDIELHLIGPLQTNKARDAVALFDVIETVDRDRLAAVLAGR